MHLYVQAHATHYSENKKVYRCESCFHIKELFPVHCILSSSSDDAVLLNIQTEYWILENV